jgi:hypothetical protein
LAIVDDKHQSDETEDASDAAYPENNSNLDFSHSPNLQLLRQGTRKKQNDNITDKTDDIVDKNQDALVETFPFGSGTPEH